MLKPAVARWRSLPAAGRWTLGVVALLVALNGLALVLDTMFGGASSGPPSSSYTTDGTGTAAFAELLRGEGRNVIALREEPSSAALEPGGTLFVLSPDEVVDEDADALSRFVDEGGRLVVAVDGPASWLERILDDAPRWSGEGSDSSEPIVPVAETDGVREVVSAGSGSWDVQSEALPVLGGDHVTVMVARAGEGRVVLIADPTILQNEFLDDADNAAFGLAAAGDPEREVLFAEVFHGYDQATGIAALPARGRWMLAALTFGALLAMVAYGRRFGPPDKKARDLPPPRRGYVDALATTLARMKDPDAAVEPLRKRARGVLARRTGVPLDAPHEQVLVAAERRDVRGSAEILLKPVTNKQELIDAGRAAAKITRGTK